jgi:CYTH domain-containing protein
MTHSKAMETERKFLVANRPRGLAKYPHRRIRQGYLAIPSPRAHNPVEVRLRNDAGKHLLTVKSGRGLSRTEVEAPIPADSFRTLWRLTEGRRIEKTRYRIPQGDLTIELDVYRGKLSGLATAEVEFDSPGKSRSFRPPDWIGREVTGQDRFSNSQLAGMKRPPGLRR